MMCGYAYQMHDPRLSLLECWRQRVWWVSWGDHVHAWHWCAKVTGGVIVSIRHGRFWFSSIWIWTPKSLWWRGVRGFQDAKWWPVGLSPALRATDVVLDGIAHHLGRIGQSFRLRIVLMVDLIWLMMVDSGLYHTFTSLSIVKYHDSNNTWTIIMYNNDRLNSGFMMANTTR